MLRILCFFVIVDCRNKIRDNKEGQADEYIDFILQYGRRT